MNALTQHQPQAAAPAAPVSFTGSSLMDPTKFEHMVRVGRMLGMSPLVPKHLREGGADAATANGVLVLNMAERLKEDPLTVAQNIYFVNGSPGWNATYMISKANQHGVFQDPIDWEIKGTGDNLSVTAFGVLASTGKKVKVTADMAMAKAENWTKNAKYRSMPEQMLRYRSATMLIRLYCPEVMVGMPTSVELELERDYKDVTPAADPARPTQDADIMSALAEPETVDAKPVEKVDRTPPKPAQKAKEPEKKPEPEVEQTPDSDIDPETGEVLDSKPEPKEKKPEPEKPKAKPKSGGKTYEELASIHQSIMNDLEEDALAPEAVLKFYDDKGLKDIEADAPELYSEIMDAVKAKSK